MPAFRFLLPCVLMVLGSVATASAQPQVPAPYRAPAVTNPAHWPEEKLLAFLRELADFVHARHVVTDPSRRTFGMVYEFWRDGKKIQEFGLDTMHDGAWFTSALTTAQRADPQGMHLKRVLEFHAPFYINILQHSDRLFPAMRPRETEERFVTPIRGWIPRGWDDGLGFDLQGRSFAQPGFQHAKDSVLHLQGERVEHSYFTSSHHLYQDVADTLLNVWLSTRDPAAADAVRLIHQGRIEHGHVIPVVRTAAGLMLGNAQLAPPLKSRPFDPAAVQPLYTGFYQLKGHALASYNDDLAWRYRELAARSALGEPLDEQAMLTLAFTAFSHISASEIFFADGSYRPGLHLFDLGGSVPLKAGTGKFMSHHPERKTIFGPRGVQIDAVAAAVLPLLRRKPDLWAGRRAAQFAQDKLLPVSDSASEQLAALEPQIVSPGTQIRLAGDLYDLHLKITSSQPAVSLTLRAADPQPGPEHGARITTGADGQITAVNSAGELLLLEHRFQPGTENWSAELRLPYTHRPGQALWLNGTEHARFLAAVDDQPPATLYLLSDTRRVIQRLEAQTLGSIDFWHDYWKRHRAIPSGFRLDESPISWNLSDAGNYAHLIKLIAFTLMDRRGESEWDLIARQWPAAPRPIPTLPDSVLQAQGLAPGATPAPTPTP